MKMSKVIREYITETVTKKYENLISEASEKRAKAESDYRKAKDQFEEKMRQIAGAEFDKQFSKYFDEQDFSKMSSRGVNVYTPSLYGVMTAKEKVYSEKVNKLIAKRDNTIKNILIELELGGTKEDLDRLLSSIDPDSEE